MNRIYIVEGVIKKRGLEEYTITLSSEDADSLPMTNTINITKGPTGNYWGFMKRWRNSKRVWQIQPRFECPHGWGSGWDNYIHTVINEMEHQGISDSYKLDLSAVDTTDTATLDAMVWLTDDCICDYEKRCKNEELRI